MSDKPIIFISHSTKDLLSEDKCVLVKNELVKVLQNKGWEVFLDSHSIKGGDIWRKEILINLATARAGVILMNGAASKSDWVKAEAMILCFRKSIDSNFPLLPVVFPDANIDATFLKTYEPFSFNEIQRSTISCTAEKSVHEIAMNLAENALLDKSFNKVSKDCPWIEGVIDVLEKITMRVLCRAAEEIKMSHQIDSKYIERESDENNLNLCRAIANLMHQKSALDCIKVFAEIAKTLNKDKINVFQKQIFSKWVDNESVETLLFVINNYRTSGIIAINTSSQDIAKRYIERIKLEMGNKPPKIREFFVEQPNGDYDQLSLVNKIERAIRKKFIEPYIIQTVDDTMLDTILNKLLEKNEHLGLCVLPCQFIDKENLFNLKKRFPRLIFFILIGESEEENTEHLLPDRSRLLKPKLTSKKLEEYTLIQMDWDATRENNFID